MVKCQVDNDDDADGVAPIMLLAMMAVDDEGKLVKIMILVVDMFMVKVKVVLEVMVPLLIMVWFQKPLDSYGIGNPGLENDPNSCEMCLGTT